MGRRRAAAFEEDDLRQARRLLVIGPIPQAAQVGAPCDWLAGRGRRPGYPKHEWPRLVNSDFPKEYKKSETFVFATTLACDLEGWVRISNL